MKKQVLIALICLSAMTHSYSQTLTPTLSNVDYVGNNFAQQFMDIYIPPGLTSPAPVIVFIHGGGWSGGSKGPGNVPYFQQSFNSGFICADINYRLSTDSVWPAQIEDCKTAIRFLKANATTYNIDTCRFGVIGGSAGGHLCVMIGTTPGVRSFEGLHQGHTNVSSHVTAVVDMYGPTDFLHEDGHYAASCGTSGLIHDYNSFETVLLGIDSLHKHPAIVQAAIPITYITPNDAHFFIIHGGGDCVVPPNQSIILDSVLKVSGIPADTLIIAAEQPHASSYFAEPAQTTLYNKFFLKHLSTTCKTEGILKNIFQNISVFPNPATTEIRVNLPSINNFTIEIINTFGETVLKTQNKNPINISELPKGIYFLKLNSANKFYMQKFIKL